MLYGVLVCRATSKPGTPACHTADMQPLLSYDVPSLPAFKCTWWRNAMCRVACMQGTHNLHMQWMNKWSTPKLSTTHRTWTWG